MNAQDGPIESGVEILARAGYAARGVVYLIVGFFAALAAFGRSEAKGTEGALAAVLGAPFGTALVWMLAIGLAGYAAWRLIQAVNDPDRHGTDAKGLVIRAGLLGSGLLNLALAFFALGLVSTWGSDGGGGDPTGGWLAAIPGAGFRWMFVWGAAAILAGTAAALIWKGATAGFEKYMRIPPDAAPWLRPLSRAGLIARGAVFLVLAGLAVRGGFAYDPADRPGLQDALKAVQGYTLGWLLLLAIGLGLAAFAAYSFAEALYRRIDPH
ncbi:DUF1206 domain-containing protein [Propylenella binzhouense]|uniref:DUF1206 domain-containing protein n=1 Tax=Propylenella binzhouense TaxID=2555902 RepID=A0A964T3G4_9HYPH|nr:DUF1206 domain-containing protein [Propylenella binzhouense]MYZ47776.1 DUF1206 domain-containing protein [Propylenella binzhouense]